MTRKVNKWGFIQKYFAKNGIIRLQIAMDLVCNICQTFIDQIFCFCIFYHFMDNNVPFWGKM